MKKIVLAALISALPLADLRRWFYCALMGYQIPASSKIGFLTVIAVSSFRLGEQINIGMFNLFKGPIDVQIGDSARIGKCNRFTSTLSDSFTHHLRPSGV